MTWHQPGEKTEGILPQGVEPVEASSANGYALVSRKIRPPGR